MCGGGSDAIKPTADMKAQQKVNAKLWNYYQESYKPLITKYAAKVTNPTTQKEESNQVAGQINAEVMKNVRPGDVSSNPVANAKRLAGIGDVKTSATQAGEAGVKSKQIGDTQNIINIGRGQATTAAQDLGAIAEQSLQKEIQSKELSMEETANLENTIGSAVGMAASGAMYGMKKSKGLDMTPEMTGWDLRS